jgi:Phytanoyl-CoA dioxygenase (PhyH)
VNRSSIAAMNDQQRYDAAAFARIGGVRVRGALDAAAIKDIENALAGLSSDQPGLRLQGNNALRPLLAASGPIGGVAATVLGDKCRPVRAILFDKSPSTNWSLPWHQDRTIVVQERAEVAGFGPWTVKSKLLHVAPPFHILDGMVTLRVHLDAVPETNAPLLIAAGSHRLGLIPEGEVKRVADASETIVCLADVGDVWVYATPILHRSDAAKVPNRRRVLQVDFAAVELPGGLKWLGV